jgi:hypothetical protein
LSKDLYNSRKITLAAIFAALYTAASFLPGFPMLGSPGSEIDFVRGLEMMYGLILGPIYGPIAAFLGAIIGKFLTGGGVGLFFTPLAPVSAFMAAVIGRKDFGKNGWRISIVIFGALIVGYYLTSIGRDAALYPVLHVISFLLILIIGGKIKNLVENSDRKKVALGIALLSLPSTMAGHILGTIIYIVMFSPSALFFLSILPVTIVERFTITAISIIVTTPIIIVVREQYPDLFN